MDRRLAPIPVATFAVQLVVTGFAVSAESRAVGEKITMCLWASGKYETLCFV